MTVKRIQQKVIYFGIWEEAVGFKLYPKHWEDPREPFYPSKLQVGEITQEILPQDLDVPIQFLFFKLLSNILSLNNCFVSISIQISNKFRPRTSPNSVEGESMSHDYSSPFSHVQRNSSFPLVSLSLAYSVKENDENEGKGIHHNGWTCEDITRKFGLPLL